MTKVREKIKQPLMKSRLILSLKSIYKWIRFKDKLSRFSHIFCEKTLFFLICFINESRVKPFLVSVNQSKEGKSKALSAVGLEEPDLLIQFNYFSVKPSLSFKMYAKL